MQPDRRTPEIGSLFQEVILDHYKRPRNKGELENADVAIHMKNPSCGDEVTLQLMVKDGVVQDARFFGDGCSISQASVSMMTNVVKGKTVEQALSLAERFTKMMHGDADAARDRELGDLRSLAGVAKFPVRVKCALLGWNALEEAVAKVSAKD